MSSKKPASSAEASAEGRQLASRLYGAGNARLSAQSPIIPHSTFGASSASGSGSLVSHYEPSLIPKARGLAGSKSSAGLLNSTQRSTQQHPLAGLNQSASQTQLRASRGRPESRALLQPLSLAKDRVARAPSGVLPAFERPRSNGPTLAGSASAASLRPMSKARNARRASVIGGGSTTEGKSSDEDLRSTAKSGLDMTAATSASARPASQDSIRPVQPKSFIQSLNLDERAIAELQSGNFLYLQPRDRMDRNAYDLMVVEHYECDQADYYTMSRAGVTHFVGNDSEYTPLEQWEREYRLFAAIRRIPFFAKYRRWKNFTVWKKTIKGEHCVAASKSLDENLFLLNKTLRISLLRLRRLCVEVSTWRLFKADATQTYMLDDFCNEQATTRAQITAWLAEFADDVRALVRGACDEVLDAFLGANNIKADHKMTFMERAALRTECRRLTRYIRLADYLVRDTLVGLALDSTETLLSLVAPSERPPRVIRVEPEDPKKRRAVRGLNDDVTPKPLINISVNFDVVHVPVEPTQYAVEDEEAVAENPTDDPAAEAKASEEPVDEGSEPPPGYQAELTSEPKLASIKSRLRETLNDAILVVSAPPRLLTHPDLSPYTQAATEEGEDEDEELDLAEVVMADTQFQDTSNGIFDALDAAYTEMLEYADVFRPFRNIFLRNMLAKDGVEDDFTDVPLSTFEDAIAKYKQQSLNFDEIPRSADIGILHVDSAELKLRLIPSPLECLSAIRELIPIILKSKSVQLLDEVKQMHTVLDSSPSEVEPFVAKVAMLEKSQESLPAFRDRHDHLKAMARLMDANQWAVPDTQKALFSMLKEGIASLESSGQAFEQRLDTDTKGFAEDIEERIPVLKKDALTLQEDLCTEIVSDADADVDEVVDFLSRQAGVMEELKERAKKYQHWQNMLKQPLQEFGMLEEIEADLKAKNMLWTNLQKWLKLTAGWSTAPFKQIDAEELDKTVNQFSSLSSKAERMLVDNAAALKFKDLVMNFRDLVPVIVNLRNKALQPRHWKEIEEIINHEFEEGHEYTLGELLELNVMEFKDDIELVTAKAAQEVGLEELHAKKVVAVWKDLEFIVNSYKDAKDIFILGSVEEITAGLDDSLVTLNTILGSRFCGPIREDVENWQQKLIMLSETLDEWLMCQKQWMYLETIFAADDIKRQLPEESKRFSNVDKSWKSIMKRTNNNPNCIVAGTVKGLKATLSKHNEALDQIQKSLEDYLETKRSAFPRFYFLSNEELLEILAQTRDPQAVQPHLRKCFDAIQKLEFGAEPGSVDILAMYSGENERVPLTKNLKARGNVEDWLMAVENSMAQSLQRKMKEGVIEYDEQPRKEWVLDHFGQIVATVAQIMWCRGTEAALLSDNPVQGMADWYEKNIQQLGELTLLVRGNLTKTQRKVIVALVTTDVHARDIVEQLYNDNVDNIGNFTWQQQLRYYWEAAGDLCVVKQSNSSIDYGYEYQGCTSRLVITPLTDRCWMTITGAVHLKLGAAPAGPAGTGKTESSKDLAKALGIQCIVFNCSDQIDYMMMGKLFSGLAQAGAWTCLDEFNRIDIEVLSVVAQQLQQLRQGILQGLTHMDFEGRHIKLRQHCVIITMNPGYAGRTELPDNLKILFRPVAMMVPDYALIAEIILFAEGFDDAKNLSRKMTKLYKLSSEQLSQQRHYDFGMRAVKSVLVMAGALKRNNPDLSEDVVLIRAMRDSNVPKFLRDDLPLFHAIVGDLFPGVVVPLNETGELQLAIERRLEEQGLQKVPKFINKTLQLFETFNVRFGVVVVGPTGGGKTTIYRTLAAAMTQLRESGSESELFQKVHISVLNPKCISMGELYGEFNDLTQEWTDGLASTIIRGYVQDETEDKRWTVFDGPIDALWIENMNTVLDDNMTLCLANGERIKLKPAMRMLFEVQDLEVASPATVSRLGVVYVTPEDLGWHPYVKSWLPREMPEDMPDEIREHLLELFFSSLDAGFKHVHDHCSEPVPTSHVQQATALCNLFTALLRRGMGLPGHGPNNNSGEGPIRMDLPEKELKRIIDSLFVFAYTWSIGGSIADTSTEGFDLFVRRVEAFKDVRFGPGSVYDSFPDVLAADSTGTGANAVPWVKWADIVPEFEYNPALPYFALVVPTIDTVRFSHLLQAQLSQLNPVFFTGVTGTGKTVIVQDFISKASSMDYSDGTVVQPILVNFSAQTKSEDTQEAVEAKLEKKRKTLLGAPANKRVVIFVDDINMPSVEEYGAQPPIELLRQFQDHKGFYDRQKLFWKDVENSVLVTAAAPPGGGRNPITPRLSRHFHMLCVPSATDEVLGHIFGSILKGFLQPFAEDVKSLHRPLVNSTVEVYNRIREAMKPTPAKSHYTFNLRDVSKVFQGVLMVQPKQCTDANVMIRLWCHEEMRVFHDRLINAEDKLWFTNCLGELLVRQFGKTGSGWQHEDLFEKKPILFVNFLRVSLDDDDGPGIYEESKDMKKLIGVLDDNLKDYNMANPTQMKLVFFRDAVEHVTRISRILRQPRGNAMLVGVGGSGKQSLTRMACAIANAACVQIELTRGYGLLEFREDIKKVMFLAGIQGKSTIFLLTDTQITDERFLEDVNNVLNTGEIAGLFASDELNKITDEVRPIAQAQGIPETRDNIYRLFVSRVRDNLHIILCMSPVGDSLRVRCRQFPSLINCCTIDWFMAWPADALLAVANRFLSEVEDLGGPEIKVALAEMCVDMHKSVDAFSDRFYNELQRKVYTTPKSYLDLIQLYLKMLGEKRDQLNAQRKRLAGGVKKLEETNAMVAGLQEELTELQPVLEVKAKETAELLEKVSKDQAEADVIKAKVEAEERDVRTQADEIAEVTADAQKDLDKAMPALNSAIKALDSLDKKDITEVKSFAKPPPAVQTVMEAVCILLGSSPDWDSAKKVLSSSSFMQDLKEYDKDNIPASMIKKVRKYTALDEMQVDNVRKVSRAATSLCMWVHAMDVYSDVAKEVEPKRQLVAELSAKLDAANAVLSEKQSQLQAVLDKVATLRKQCDDTVAEKDRLAHEAELTKNRLVRADKLTSGLADEQIRWKESVGGFDVQIRALIGDVLLSAACISYYGAFIGDYRKELVGGWLEKAIERKIPCTEDFSLLTTMGDPVQVREWQINGLPTDAVSVDNAILVTRGQRWPLMIDPQEQAKKWIKNTEAKNSLAVTRLSNPNMLRTLENCIRIGRPLLLEDIGETLDPALEPVLAKAVFKQSGRLLIHLGDSDVDYDPTFKLYMSTKLPNPHYLPEVCIKVTIINFTVTMSGLEDQLLGAVVKKERPDIEEKKNRLVVSMAADKKQLQDLEDKILKLLSESEGNILDDQVLIATLGESKQLSVVINERLAESEKTNEEITEMRNRYRPAAIRGSIIYFVVADLARIDPMYQFSLAYFVKLFNICIDDSEKSKDLDQRLSNLMDYMTLNVYRNVCRGLFESHKLIFSFLICVQILRNRGDIDNAAWSLLLRGAGMAINEAENPLPDQIAEPGWNLLAALERDIPDTFEGLVDHVINNTEAWKLWGEGAEPQNADLPEPWHEKCDRMERMLVLKAFREEKLMFTIKDFVVANLGKPFVESPPVSMVQVHGDTDFATPVIFILSVGADPTGLLFSFAKQRKYIERLRLISLGQGQGPRAQQLIEDACKTGDWVLLQNCHLAKSWMPSLEKIVEGFADTAMTGATIHPDFRLFLTSMPAQYFPVPVLQNGVKLTNEPPKGIRANLTRSLANLESWTAYEECEGEFEDGMEKLFAWKKLAFGLCFFHAIIQERRKFGPLGWNIFYEFNDSDLETSIQVLKMFLEEQPQIPWDALRYVTGQINYGGRVTDDWDRRCLMSILGKVYNPQILEADYKFSESGLFYAPAVGPLDSLKEYVDGLPLDDDPEIFGMHENANISFQARETDNILKTCLSIQPRSGGGGGGKSPDAIAAELAIQIAEDLPEDLSMEEAGKSTFVYKGEHMDSLATVLSQEMVRFNKLLRVMRASLADLQKAIRGEVLMSNELDKMFTSLINNQVPEMWEAQAYPSLKPLASWVKDLHARLVFMRDWLRHGQPRVFWLSGFFFPQGFMTGTLQNHARKYAIPIDTLAFSFKIFDEDEPEEITEETAVDDGVLIHGLFMDGARWDKETRSVEECKPGEIYAAVPIIHFIPTKDYKPSPDEYSAPIYKTSVRAGTLSTTGMSTNFIVAVEMPSRKDPASWVLQGAALLCQLND